MTEETSNTDAQDSSTDQKSNSGLVQLIEHDYDYVKQYALSHARELLTDLHKNGSVAVKDVEEFAEKIVMLAKKFEDYMKAKL